MALEAANPHLAETRGVAKISYSEIDRIADRFRPGAVQSVSGAKNIVAVGEDELKWEQNERPGIVLRC